MIAKAGPTSEVAKACTVIALANLGKKGENPTLAEAAENLHSSLLRSFRLSISRHAMCISVESLITAALLGLYEVSSHPVSRKEVPDIHRSSQVLMRIVAHI